MLNQNDILETQAMIEQQHLDIRTITMGISLLDCCDPDLSACCEKIYNKITRLAKNLVSVGEEIEAEFGIPLSTSGFLLPPLPWLPALARPTVMWRLQRRWMPLPRPAA